MRLNQIRQIVREVKEKIEANEAKYAKQKCSLFLEKIGMQNKRNKKVLKRFDKQFMNNGIRFWMGKEEVNSLWDFEKDDTIVFKMNNNLENNSKERINDKQFNDNIGKQKVKNSSAGTIKISNEKSSVELYSHQKEAIEKLNDILHKKGDSFFSGLLVLPTGGGKTLTAAYWLAQNYLDERKKILWIAHRHELLEQAKDTFHKKVSFRDIVPNIDGYKYRILSGIHDKPVNIKEEDDILIATVGSLSNGFRYLYDRWMKKIENEELILVIDEAHHATAKTYRKLIEKIKENITSLKILGLTATPFRTAEEEMGLLLKVFPDNIIHKVDLRTLINRGILSEAIFESIETGIDLTKNLSEKELESLKYFDIESLGKNTAKTIAENRERNWKIVNTYLSNKRKYGQTLVFALNQDNAIALNALFRKQGVKSDYVISSVRDMNTGATLSPKENKIKIEKFRKKELNVLINVNILTEGTDIPNVETVFLGRQTISKVLMTQMIGRGLRGKKAGGTEKTYIVSFVDDWKDKINWVNPEKIIAEDSWITEEPKERQKKLLRLISINKIEEFAILADKKIDSKTKAELEKLEFIQRVPVGIYAFSFLSRVNDEEDERNIEVLVYDNIKKSYFDFINSLEGLFEEYGLSEKDDLNEKELSELTEIVENEFFYGCEKYPGYVQEDIKNILLYYAQTGETPQYIELKERDKYNLDEIARNLVNKTGLEEKSIVDEIWENEQSGWKALFGINNKEQFIREISLAKQRVLYPDMFKKQSSLPIDEKELVELSKLSMWEIRERNPQYWKYLEDKVYEKFCDSDGFYFSATRKYKSKDKRNFQIDHIKPMHHGGLTVLENLQLLTKGENAKKGYSI